MNGQRLLPPVGLQCDLRRMEVRSHKSAAAAAAATWWQQEPAVIKNQLIALQSEQKLHTLTMPEIRGVLKQFSKSTKGTKQLLLTELSKLLHQDSRKSLPWATVLADEKFPKRASEDIETSRCSKAAKLVQATNLVGEAAQAWSVLVHKKSKPEWVAYHPPSMRPQMSPTPGYLKVLSWNVNGLRALLKRKDEKQQVISALAHLAETENFDIICLQETKLQEKDVEAIKCSILENYSSSFWSCSTSKLGYSGSALISRVKPLSLTTGLGNPVHDDEGRIITAEFDTFFLVTAYVPNSGQKLERLAYRTNEWDPALSNHLMDLQKKKPVVLTGDLNCAHQEIDIHDPDRNRKNAGFTNEERESFEARFLQRGLVDTFRKQHPTAVGYTFWNYRTNARRNNKGWRLDYFLVSESLQTSVLDSYTLPHVDGSDHCPVGLVLRTS